MRCLLGNKTQTRKFHNNFIPLNAGSVQPEVYGYYVNLNIGVAYMSVFLCHSFFINSPYLMT